MGLGLGGSLLEDRVQDFFYRHPAAVPHTDVA